MNDKFVLIGGLWRKDKPVKDADGKEMRDPVTGEPIMELAFNGAIYVEHFKYRIYIGKNHNINEKNKQEYKVYHIRGLGSTTKDNNFLK